MVLRLIHPDDDHATREELFEAQAWLYRLTDAVSRATDPGEILDHSLDCLLEVLRVEKAAILLNDQHRVMRFRAWRNLSDGYRQAVDGHSPWSPDDPDPQPVLIEDVAADPDLEPLRPVIAAEGIAALAFVPLLYGGRLLGKFMVYHPRPHSFTRLELAIARAVAGHVALAVGRQTDAAELRHTRDQLAISEEAARFVAEVTGLLAGSLEPQETCTRLAQVLVPRLGDGCAVYTIDESGTARRTACAGTAWGRSDADELVRRAIADGTVLVADRPAVCVPLRGREGVLGAVCLDREGHGRAHEPHEVALAEEVARRGAIALEAALLYRQATEAIRLRDDFLSVAGHELRTPLTTAHILVQSMSRGPALPETVRQRIGKLELTMTRLAQLVDDLLDVSRIRAGRLALEPQPTDLGELAREVCGRCREQAARAGSELRVAVDGDAGGQWDPGRLAQVIENLVGNAIKYAPGEPIDVTIGDRGGDAVLAVRDRGNGIAEADRDRVFGRFERASSSRHYGGLGLGLWITREIVEAHGGRIAFVEPDGLGCCVEVVLPR